MSLMQMSLSGAVMILAIVVIRALAIHKLPKRAFLVLWGVVTVRLLVPYSLCSAFSVYSMLEPLAPADISAGQFTPAAPSNSITPSPALSAADTTAVFIDPWAAVWLIGMLACGLFFAMAYLKCHKEFKASLPVDNEYTKHWLSEHHRYRTIEIRQSGRISAPLTYGVFRPVILMPKTTDWDNSDTLKYVLAHEYLHICRLDAVTKLVLTAALCVHWFNPAVWIMNKLANRDIELSCDEAVIRQFGERTKSAYAMALIRMEETRSGLTPLCNNFSKNAIEERIVAIMKIKKISLVTLVVTGALIFGVTTAFATSAKPVENPQSERPGSASDTAGAIDVRAVRQRVENPDGSFDPMGPLTGLEPYPREDFEERVFLNPSLEAETYVDQDAAGQELLELYAPFGLTYEYETTPDNEIALRMNWQGKPVHSVYDGEKGVWVANSMQGLYLGPDAVDLEAVYDEDGKLAGLRETQSHATTDITFVAEGDTAEPGTTFTELFEKYASFGITYEEAEGASGAGNVYYNGRLVSRFADLTPDGGAFTFSSAQPGGIAVKTDYDSSGKMAGVEIAAE